MYRMLLFAALLPLLLFVWLCCTAANSVAAVHRCGYDAISDDRGPQPKAMVVELPQKGRSGVSLLVAASTENNEWAPIRIKFFAEDLRNESRYCTKAGDIRRSFRDGEMHTCEERDVLTEEKKSILVNEIVPKAIKMHSDRLLVQNVAASIIVSEYTGRICSRFTIPDSHHTQGVEDTDLVLYVAAGPDDAGAPVAWASACFLDAGTLRPIIGVTDFNPSYITLSDYMVRTAAHEIGHVLGFDLNFIEAFGMLKNITDGSIRGKPKVYLATGRKTVEKAREHYNCTNITGMELEDKGDNMGAGWHWEMHNAKDELMAPIIGAGYYTSLTMALFEDLGFYRANWSMAETMAWGRNAGCEFLEKKCVTNGKTNFPDMSCVAQYSIMYYHLCVSDRSGLGVCNNMRHKKPSPKHFWYFGSSLIGGYSEYADYCPYISLYQTTQCADGTAKLALGSRFGKNSKCLKGDELRYNGIAIGDVCADIKCDDGTVSVRYYGNDTWIDCPYGEAITPRGGFSKGTIVCPKYHEVCLDVGADKSPVDLSPPTFSLEDKDVYDEETQAVTRLAAEARNYTNCVVRASDGEVKAYNRFGKNMDKMLPMFTEAIRKFASAIEAAFNIKTNNPTNIETVRRIEGLQQGMIDARAAADALIRIVADSQGRRGLINIVPNRTRVVKAKVSLAENAVRAMKHNNVSSIEGVIQSAKELRVAAEMAKDQWFLVLQEIIPRYNATIAALEAIWSVPGNLINLYHQLIGKTDPSAKATANILRSARINEVRTLKRRLYKLANDISVSKTNGESARQCFGELAERADELQKKANETKKRFFPE